jgi:small basic protein
MRDQFIKLCRPFTENNEVKISVKNFTSGLFVSPIFANIALSISIMLISRRCCCAKQSYDFFLLGIVLKKNARTIDNK